LEKSLIYLGWANQTAKDSVSFHENRTTARGALSSAFEAKLLTGTSRAARRRAASSRTLLRLIATHGSDGSAPHSCRRLRCYSIVNISPRPKHSTRSQLRTLTWTANYCCLSSATASSLGASCDLPEPIFSTGRGHTNRTASRASRRLSCSRRAAASELVTLRIIARRACQRIPS
jgi:hypothetical protein